jgi:hypothetical protein
MFICFICLIYFPLATLQLIYHQGLALSALSFKPISSDEIRSSSPFDMKPASASMGSSPVPDVGSNALLDLANPETSHLIFTQVENYLHFFRK